MRRSRASVMAGVLRWSGEVEGERDRARRWRRAPQPPPCTARPGVSRMAASNRVRAACSAWRWASQTLSAGIGRPWRSWNAAVARSISAAVSASCRCSVYWWVWSVTKTEQVRQALPLSQVCSGGSRHQPWGRNRSARSNRCRLSWSSRENSHPAAVGLELRGGQERLLGVFLALRDVVHRHRRRGVPGIALQHLDRQAELGETGEAGVAEPVGVAQPHRPARAIGDRDDVAELAQHPCCSCPAG